MGYVVVECTVKAGISAENEESAIESFRNQLLNFPQYHFDPEVAKHPIEWKTKRPLENRI